MTLLTAALAALLAMQQPAPAPEAAPTIVAGPAMLAGDPASTAVKLHEYETRMTVPVTINGAGPFAFIVDSGATRTVISSRLATLLNLPSAGIVSLHSVGGESQVGSVKIDALTLGGLPAKPIVAPVLDEENLGAVGILGIDTLADKKVVIDLDANRMTIEEADRRTAPPANNEIIVVARRRYGQLVLADAEAAGLRIYAVVDTGSMVTIGNSVLREKLVRRKRAIPQSVDITDVTGLKIRALFAAISDMRLGAWHMNNVVIAFSDAHAFHRFGLDDKPAMLLGMDMMRASSRVSIDFKRRTVRLLRRGERSDSGLTLSIHPD